MTRHPVAPVPDRLFDDETGAALAGPLHRSVDVPAAVGPGRAGPLRLHVERERHHRGLRLGPRHRPHRRVTDRRSGTHAATLHARTARRCAGSPTPTATSSGTGSPSRSPAGRPTPSTAPVLPGVAGRLPGRPGDRARGRGRGHLDRRRHHGSGCAAATARRRGVYTHAEDAGVGGAVRGRDAARDRPLRARRLPAPRGARGPGRRRRARSPRSPTAPAEGLTPLAFAPVPGDPRLLLLHERRGREELLIWDVVADTEREMPLDLPGELVADFYPDGTRAAGRAHPRGPHPAAPVRPDTRRAERAAGGPGLVGSADGPTGRHRGVHLLVGGRARRGAGAAPGRLRPAARCPARRAGRPARCRSRTSGSTGPGGPVHALVSRPPGVATVRGRRCSPARWPARGATRTGSTRSARPGSTPASPSWRSTTAARRATARRGGTRSRAGPG